MHFYDLPPFGWWQARRMMRDPNVRISLAYIKSPIHQMKVVAGPPNPAMPDPDGGLIPKIRVLSQDQRVAKYLAANLRILWDQELGKILRCIEDGVSLCGVEYQERAGLLFVDTLRQIDPEYARILADPKTGTVVGVRWTQYNSLLEQPPTNEIQTPGKWLHVVHQAEYDHFYGASHLIHAYEPFLELHGPLGAKEIIRNWFYRCAAMGFVIRYPEGMTYVSGEEVRNVDLARQMLDRLESCSNITMPTTIHPDTGKYQWDLQYPTVNGDGRSFLEYREQLRRDIMLSLGVPPEVVEAADTTGALAGRRVPQMSFFMTLKEIVKEVLAGIQTSVLDPLCQVTFGHEDYSVQADNILPTPQQPPPMLQAGPPGGAPPEGGPPQ